MNSPVDYRPEPLTPEHQLIRDAAVLPELSRELRSRVMLDCQGQIRAARWKRRLSVAGALAAVACLLLMLMHTPESTSVPTASENDPVPIPLPETPSYMSPGAQDPVMPVPSGDRSRPGSVKQGVGDVAGGEGVEPTPQEKQKKLEPRSNDEINLLIDELHRRNRRLCGIFAW